MGASVVSPVCCNVVEVGLDVLNSGVTVVINGFGVVIVSSFISFHVKIASVQGIGSVGVALLAE